MLIPVGIIASTFATIVTERASASCPDKTLGCEVLEAGEPVVIALLDASDPSAAWPFEDVAHRSIPLPSGRSARIDLLRPRCSVERASEVAREAVSDPPDEPQTVLVIAGACQETAVPVAQILGDAGIPVVFLNPVAPIPTDPGFALEAPPLHLEDQAIGVQGIGVVSHLREVLAAYIQDIVDRSIGAIQGVAVRDGDELLIPRRPLRDALIAEGFSSA
jgi:hypothetical protein